MKKLLFLSSLIFISVNSIAQNYFVTASADGVEEIYILSVTSNRHNNTMLVFDRVKPAEGKLQDFRSSVKKVADKKQVDADKLDKLGYYRRKIQYSCPNKTYRIMEVTYNEIAGKELGKAVYEEKETQWHKITPGSIIDMEFKNSLQEVRPLNKFGT